MNDNRQQDADSDLFHYLRVASRRGKTVVLSTALGVAAMAAYAFLAPPVYESTALVSVDKVSGDVSSSDSQRQKDFDESYFETQIKLIASETELRHVYQVFKLEEKPEFSEGLRALRRAVSVTPVPRARLATVSVESRDPKLAAALAGALAHDFVNRNLDNQLYMSKNELNALQQRTSVPDSRVLVESLPAVVNNKLIQDIKTQIFNAEAALADLRTRYTPQYPEVQALTSRLESMRKVRDREIDNIVGSLKTELSGQLRSNNVRIVDEPLVPELPIRPRKILALLLGLPLGLALGLFAALAQETFDQTILTHQDVERRLSLPFLGQIPQARRSRGAPVYAPLMSEEITPSSESFRNLRTIVGLAHKGANDPVLLVTSTSPAEGKSYVAANLAVAFAQAGERVLIVDGDLRRPTQHQILPCSGKSGLCDYLSGASAAPGAAVQPTGLPRLDLAPCGARPKNPAELLHSDRVEKFLVWARANYDRVVVDCPPVFPVSDVLLWGRHAGAAVFVARHGRTRVPLIQTACARLKIGGVKIMGGVINGARLNTTLYAEGRYVELY